MIRYMGHGLKLPLLACMRHPALPVPPSWWDHGSGLPIRLGHILNVPVGSMRSIDLFIKVQGCLPKRLFMPLTPIPERLPMICPQSCHFHENTSRPLTRAVRQFFHCSNSFRLATIASMSCSLGLCGASDGWLIPTVGTGVPPRNPPMELFTISRTIVKSCSFV